MSSNVRAFPSPMVMPPQQVSPAQQGWVWDGVSWTCDPCNQPMPPPCPPPGWPTPCPPWFPPPAGQAPWYPGANGGVSFSSSPPANPIRGNFWWDGMVLHLFDGAAWVDIGPGAAGGGGAFVGTNPPPTPAVGALWWNGTALQLWDGTKWNSTGTTIQFALQGPSSATIGTPPTWLPVPFTGSPTVDPQMGWNSGTLRFTPKVSGYYTFEARGVVGTGTGTQGGGIAIVKNDPGSFASASTDIVVGIAMLAPTQETWISTTGIVQMNGSTDYVRVFAWATNGVMLNGSNPAFAGFLMA